ncbi:PLL family lectin [Caballeronia grimmiae]|uniref:hypothetical protein n=1 Tax=Caballeronia grimmiae TaxID=1071679 RepID=UPI0038BC4EFB
MTKEHVVELTIENNTDSDLQWKQDWFGSGRLADNNSWPQQISAGTTAKITCYEKDWALAGCSGWTKYEIRGRGVFFCFSNPTVGTNGIAMGTEDSAWDDMTGRYDNGITVPLQIDGNLWLKGHICSTGGDHNYATFNLTLLDMSAVTLSNIELVDVKRTFAGVSAGGSRRYYKCDVAPTYLTGLVESHFKGIAAYADNIIFAHTNLDRVVNPENGAYLIADKITVGNQGVVELTATTAHPGWVHPCSSQACGSFMALGMQESASNPSNTSEVHIYDIRPAQINQPIVLLTTIRREAVGVNGVGLTKESGASGRYVVATVNGPHLIVYRSDSPDLLKGSTTFNVVLDIGNFPESGAGLALVTEKSGDIYMFALNAEDNGDDNHMSLFKLDISHADITKNTATQVGVNKPMPVPGTSDSVDILNRDLLLILAAPPPYDVMGAALQVVLRTVGVKALNSSFRWGKGLAVTSASTVEVYATDRNVWPLSRIPLLESDKDFSLVTWATESTPSFAGQLTACSSSPNTLDLFGLDGDHNLIHRFWDGQSWHAENLGAGPGPMRFAGWLAAYASDGNRMSVFGQTASNDMLHAYWDGRWHWETIPMEKANIGKFAACCWRSTGVGGVFGVDERGVQHSWWDGAAWHTENLTNVSGSPGFNGQLLACAWSRDRTDVFGLDVHGTVQRLRWDGSSWHYDRPDIAGLGGVQYQGRLAACSWGENRIDVFGVGESGDAQHSWWDGTNWATQTLGNPFHPTRFAGQIAACSWGENRIDVFGLNQDGELLHMWWDGSSWQARRED